MSNITRNWGSPFAAGFILACVLIFSAAAAAPHADRYSATFQVTGNSLLLEVVDHNTNMLRLYKRMSEDTYELKEQIDLNQSGKAQLKIIELDEK